MATFTGTADNEQITLTTVSPTVTTDGAPFPGSGPDTIFGYGGDDTIVSGGGADVITGGLGADNARMGAGNDVFHWNPGDGSDVIEGGADTDLLDFAGSNINENIEIAASGSRARLFRDVATISMDFHGIENILVHAVGGTDTITVQDLTGTGIKNVGVDLAATSGGTTGDGQVDTVTVNAPTSADNLSVVVGPTAVVVKGLDWTTRVRNPELTDKLQIFGNDGNDTVSVTAAVASELALGIDGGTGKDTLDVAPQTIANIALANIAGTVQAFFGGTSIALQNIEHFTLHAGDAGGIFTIGDLSGTSAKRIDIDLTSASGTAQSDTVSVVGSSAADAVVLSSLNNVLSAKGLPADVFLHNADRRDHLSVDGGFGADRIDASAVAVGASHLVLRGGADADFLVGSNNADRVFGNTGDDVALMGDGSDTFFWFPGDGSDTIEGQAGNDRLDFAGANISETIDIEANGGRVRFFRDVASIVMDINDVERLTYHALGGSDRIAINDLSGTGVKSIAVNLEGVSGSGSGDGQFDYLSVFGSNNADDITIAATATGHVINGLPWRVSVIGQETMDTIFLSAGAGSDTIDASAAAAGYSFTIDSGFGNDTLSGGLADDTFVFSTALSAANIDTIKKFSVADDTMQLEDSVFSGIGATGALAPSAFHSGSEATDPDQRIIYDPSNGRLYFDSDGMGGSAQVQFAKLQAGLSLTSSDFVVI
jgi:hypothetical protein